MSNPVEHLPYVSHWLTFSGMCRFLVNHRGRSVYVFFSAARKLGAPSVARRVLRMMRRESCERR